MLGPYGIGNRWSSAGTHQAEDREHGGARGDALPRALAGRAERLAKLQHAKAHLEAEAAARQQRYQQPAPMLAALCNSSYGQRPGRAGSQVA